MGTTATSLHILSPPANPASLSGEVEKAYRKVGYTKPKKPAGKAAAVAAQRGPAGLGARSSAARKARMPADCRRSSGFNTPSVLAMAAILPDDGDASRDRVRELVETWLGRLSPEPGTTAVIHTQHMSPSRRLAKSTRLLPLQALTTDKLWPKLFSEASGYQRVLIGLHQADMPHPHAGLALQGADPAVPQTRHGPGAELCPLNAGASVGATEIGRVAGSPDRPLRDLARLGRSAASLGHSHGLDTRIRFLGGFAQTLYESAATVDWFRSRTDDFVAGGRVSLARRLRFVAPKLWLDESLMRNVDRAALAAVAMLRQRQRTTEISLAPGKSLTELEAALAPLLPTFVRLG